MNAVASESCWLMFLLFQICGLYSFVFASRYPSFDVANHVEEVVHKNEAKRETKERLEYSISSLFNQRLLFMLPVTHYNFLQI